MVVVSQQHLSLRQYKNLMAVEILVDLLLRKFFLKQKQVQQWLQLQKVRAKAKKKVDTKASKGRKTRYDIHAKLVNFMAPTYPVSTLTEEAKNELFASLFKAPTQ